MNRRVAQVTRTVWSSVRTLTKCGAVVTFAHGSGLSMLNFLTAAARAGAIVFGITALATLVQKLVFNSGLRETPIVHQLSWPGALWLAKFLETFTFGFAVLLFAFLVAKPYWRALFP